MTDSEKHTANERGWTELPDAVTKVVLAAQSKKGSNVVVLDLRGVGACTDFFVICSGRNRPQVKAIADAVQAAVVQRGTRPRVEGYAQAKWILLDCFDLVVHVFTPQTRAFYDLERLWGSANRVEVPELEHERPSSR